MKIKTFILVGTLLIVGITLFVVLFTEIPILQEEFKYQFSSQANDSLRNFDSGISTTFYNFSGKIDNGILEIVHGAPIDSTLEKMKNSFGSDWAFVTIDSTNYIYPAENTSSLTAQSRPWYLLATSNPKVVVGNEFYSPSLESTVVTMTVAFNENGKMYVGGLIFEAQHFFNILSSKFGGPFIIFKNGKVVYPTDFSYDPFKEVIRINGQNYLIYRTDYDKLLSKQNISSSTGYTLGIPVPLGKLLNFMDNTIYSLIVLLFILGISEIVLMILIARRIGRSVSSLANVSEQFDPKKGKIEVDERSEKSASNFKETKQVYQKMNELFQEVEAQIEELRATNEELENSYEEIEQLSNSLSKETQELKALSETSNLISLSDKSADAMKILLDKLMKIYDCDGIIIVDAGKNEIVNSIGMKFNPVNLLPLRETLVANRTIAVPSGNTDVLIVPIVFEAKLLATIEMVFSGHVPSESEQESLKRFMIGFGSSLNSQKLICQIQNSYIYLASKFAEISEIYDYETGSHIHRVGEYSAFISERLKMPSEFTNDIKTYAMIHDIGKLKVPRDILTKNGPLTKIEFEEMKKHTIYGEQLLGDEPFLEMARHIARYHHEKYDGSGYPDGLKGEEIPVEARITAIADIYDALRSPRRYKKAFTHEETVKIILEGDGRVEPQHFDPKILEIFRKDNIEFSRIYESLLDEE